MIHPVALLVTGMLTAMVAIALTALERAGYRPKQAGG